MDVTGLGTMPWQNGKDYWHSVSDNVYIYIKVSGSSSQTSLSFTISRVLYPNEYEPSWSLQSCNLSGATSTVRQHNISHQSGRQSRQWWLPRPVNKQIQIHEPSYLGTLQWIKYSPADSDTPALLRIQPSPTVLCRSLPWTVCYCITETIPMICRNIFTV
jgi:hypothetical protein